MLNLIKYLRPLSVVGRTGQGGNSILIYVERAHYLSALVTLGDEWAYGKAWFRDQMETLILLEAYVP